MIGKRAHTGIGIGIGIESHDCGMTNNCRSHKQHTPPGAGSTNNDNGSECWTFFLNDWPMANVEAFLSCSPLSDGRNAAGTFSTCQ
jgi:hypothetical protein